MAKKKVSEEEIQLALNHELRVSILRWISKAKAALSPKEASSALQHPLSQVAYHVRVLAAAKLLTEVKTVPVRGSLQHFYILNPETSQLPIVVKVIGN